MPAKQAILEAAHEHAGERLVNFSQDLGQGICHALCLAWMKQFDEELHGRGIIEDPENVGQGVSVVELVANGDGRMKEHVTDQLMYKMSLENYKSIQGTSRAGTPWGKRIQQRVANRQYREESFGDQFQLIAEGRRIDFGKLVSKRQDENFELSLQSNSQLLPALTLEKLCETVVNSVLAPNSYPKPSFRVIELINLKIGGNHAIAIYVGNESYYDLFDPNFGLFSFTSQTGFEAFLKDYLLHSDYFNLNTSAVRFEVWA